jgi:hypothetical protein
MKLTARAIIKWEQLTRKPFSSISNYDEDEAVTLFYACKLSEGATISLSEFRESLTDDSISKMIMDYERQKTIIELLSPPKKETEEPEETEETETSKAPVSYYVKDLIPMLIMDGLDADFALNEMEISEIPVFLDAYEKKNRRNQESSRLWTFLQVSPHLPKKIRRPEDYLPFPWEIRERKIKARKEAEKGKDTFEAFMKSKKEI